MASQGDVKAIDHEGKVSQVRRFNAQDFQWIAEYVIETHEQRQKDRKDREKHWKEIDRQVAMEPDNAFKYIVKNGTKVLDSDKVWMSEIEPPLQAQTLEVCTADARRFMFADTWFRAHAEMSDDFLSKVDFKGLILGDKAEVPSVIDQDNADKLVEGFQYHQFRQYDFTTRWDRVNAEAIKYGMGVARARMQTKQVFIHESSGTRKETHRLPVLVPCSIKKLYLDDPLPSMHTSHEFGPGHIAEDYIKLEALQIAANKGSNDPDNEDGGWMPGGLKGVEPDKDGFVTVLEFEGDLVVPRKTVRALVLPGVIVTVLKGAVGKDTRVTRGVIRLRWRKTPYSSYLLAPYHYESADEHYPTSPLEKGRPLQIMVAECLNKLIDSGALKNAPPVGYDRSDVTFGREGGPRIHPYAVWDTIEQVVVHDKVGGDQSALTQALRLAISLYAELTGVLPGRIGAQTVSHTTAFAKDAELSRGAVRTIDYVNATGEGPMTRWLHMSYDMGRNAIKRGEKVSFFSDAYGGFLQVGKDQLPERATFKWFGSGGPSEEQAKNQRKLTALQFAIQLDNLKLQQDQLGASGTLNLDAAIRQVLREGGWTDVDTITNLAQAAQQGSGGNQNGQFNPGAQSTSLQQIGLLEQ